MATSRGVYVIKTSQSQDSLGSRSSYKAGTARSRDEAHANGTALSAKLVGYGVWLAGHLSPVTTADWNYVHLCVDDSTTDGGSYLLSALYTHADVALAITDSHTAAEAGALTSRSLLLHRHDLHDFVLALVTQDLVYDLVLLDRHGEQEDLFQGLYLAILDKAAELGAWNPLFLTTLATLSGALASSLSLSTSLALASLSLAATAESAALSFRCWCCYVCHFVCFLCFGSVCFYVKKSEGSNLGVSVIQSDSVLY
jgi:hypothetical protein